MKYELFVNKMERISVSKASRLLEEYKNNVGFKYFAEQQKALDVLVYKSSIARMIDEDVFKEAAVSLKMAANMKNREWAQASFDNMKNNPMVVWIEIIDFLDDNEKRAIIDKFYKELPAILLETFIINIENVNMQVSTIEKYSKLLDINSGTYENFYYSVSSRARNKLEELFPNVVKTDIFLILRNIEEINLVKYIKSNKKDFDNISMDDILDFLLLNINYTDIIMDVLDIFRERIDEISDNKFEIFILRYIHIRNDELWAYNDESNDKKPLTDEELLTKFKNKFHSIGLVRTLSLFRAKANYYGNKLGESIIYEFLDEAYQDDELKPYINDAIITDLTNKYVAECDSREYSLDDFIVMVDNLQVLDKTKLIHDDYIKAMIVCHKLMNDGIINNAHPYFIKLRDLFIKQELLTIERDNTYLEDVNLKGIFYRLVKGTLDFDTFYKIKTYRGLIYLTKCGDLSQKADIITNFLTDEQVAKLDIRLLIRFKKELVTDDKKMESEAFYERMGLQLLCFFGELKFKYLMTCGIKGNRMENLFDGINYHQIKIGEDGKPIVIQSLIDFLFGKGPLNGINTIMNKMVRGEIPEFEKYFTELCNNYDQLLEDCKGVLSVKRLVNHFESFELPVELKPDGQCYLPFLKELNTTNESVICDAISLCNEARKRTFSTIPKVKGSLGNFDYEMLDYKNPFAICVGYLSHCCFTVHGISYTALQHSMASVNGRTFVVYYDKKFFAQSWVWRNGDVVCFDSVEAGSPVHEAYEDSVGITDVYKRAASEILNSSEMVEDDIQKIKVVTVGKSDYKLENLEEVKGQVARPLEREVYVYDSNSQKILAGSMPKEIRYGVVGAQYKDPRNKVIAIPQINSAGIDLLDVALEKLLAIRYQVYGKTDLLDLNEYKSLFIGDDWYILIDKNGIVETGLLRVDEAAEVEFNNCLRKYGIRIEQSSEPVYDLPNIKLSKVYKPRKKDE